MSEESLRNNRDSMSLHSKSPFSKVKLVNMLVQKSKLAIFAVMVCLGAVSCATPKQSFLGSWKVKSGGPPSSIILEPSGDMIINGKKGATWKKRGDHIKIINPYSGKVIVGTLTPDGYLRLVGNSGHIQILKRR